MNDPDAEYAYVEQLAGEELQRWLVVTVKVSEAQAGLVLEQEITGRDLLTTSDLDRLLESVKLKAGPRSRIAEKIKELKGDLRSCCLLAVLLVVSLFLKGRCLAVVARPPRLARFISDGFSLSAPPCSDVSTARKQALAAAAATGRSAGSAVPPLPEAPAAGTPFSYSCQIVCLSLCCVLLILASVCLSSVVSAHSHQFGRPGASPFSWAWLRSRWGDRRRQETIERGRRAFEAGSGRVS